jgi:hypothetical protein
MLPELILTTQLYRQERPGFSGGEFGAARRKRSNSRTPEARTENKTWADNARESRHEDSRPANEQKEQKSSKQSKHEKPSRQERDR